MSSPADAAADPYADPCALTAVRHTAVRAHAVLPAAAGVRGTLQHTLVRLPAVRSPWMRAILKKLAQGGSASLF